MRDRKLTDDGAETFCAVGSCKNVDVDIEVAGAVQRGGGAEKEGVIRRELCRREPHERLEATLVLTTSKATKNSVDYVLGRRKNSKR